MVSAWDFPSNQSILLGFWRCWIAHWLDGARKIPSPDTKSLEFQIVIIYPMIYSIDTPERYPQHGGLKKSTDVIPFYPHLMSPYGVGVSMTVWQVDGAPKGLCGEAWSTGKCLWLVWGAQKPWKNHGDFMAFFFHEKWMVCFIVFNQWGFTWFNSLTVLTILFFFKAIVILTII